MLILHELGLGREGLGNGGIYLPLIAGGVDASCLPRSRNGSLLCPVRLGQSTQFPAAGTSLRIALVERREFGDEKNVRLNPEMQTANGEQDAFGLLASRTPILFEACGESPFLLGGLELLSIQLPNRALQRQKERRSGRLMRGSRPSCARSKSAQFALRTFA